MTCPLQTVKLCERPYAYLKMHPNEWMTSHTIARECDTVSRAIGKCLYECEGIERRKDVDAITGSITLYRYVEEVK